MAKTAKKKPMKISPASQRRSRGDVVRTIAEATELKPAKVKEVFGALSSIMAADLGKKGPGEFNFNGLVKLRTVDKPASRKIRARALRSLNGLI